MSNIPVLSHILDNLSAFNLTQCPNHYLIANMSLVNVSLLTLLKATVLQTGKKTGAALVSDQAVCQREGITSTPLTYHVIWTLLTLLSHLIVIMSL